MTRSREALISTLAEDLDPGRFRAGRVTLVWLTASVAFMAVTVPLTGPVRDGLPGSLIAAPRFAVELAAAALAFAGAARLAFALAVPGRPWRRTAAVVGTGLLAWLALLGWAHLAPPLDALMLDKRPFCALEVILLGMPLFLAGRWLLSRGYCLQPARACFTLGLAAGVLGAAAMQMACMYQAEHALVYHLGPAALLAAIAAVAGRRWPERSAA